MSRVLFMCGPAGSGKSTYARRLESEGFVRLSFDTEAWERGVEQPLSRQLHDEIEADLRARLLELIDQGRDVVLDFSFWSRRMRADYRRLVEPHGIIAETVYLDAPRDVVLGRVRQRANDHADDVALSEALAAEYFDHFEPPSADEGPLTVVSYGEQIVRQNRDYWEALAPHRLGEPVEFFRNGGSALTDAERAALGEVAGRRVLQLACSVGDEALSFAMLGADVTAVDIAPSHLATGRAKAAELGLDVTFAEQDMMILDPAISGFDVVYISWGGLCWVPDLNAWARLVAGRLNPGGILVISEHHPLWEVLTVTGDSRLMISGDYFGSGRIWYADALKAPEITRTIGTPDVSHRSFVWGIGRVVTAVLDAGLTLTSLQEFGDPTMYPGLGDAADDLPAIYLLAAVR
ncbi:MAG: AAA family ATPase [Microlunatus sp.]|nr:AAA family ATPase [Microlunatus sp.]